MTVKIGTGVLDHPYKNNWEREFSQLLDMRKKSGEVLQYWYEGLRFQIGNGAWFTPDFPTLLATGEMVIYEVKGFRRPASIVRIKAAAKQYPFKFFIVTKQKDGGWKYDEI